MAGRLLRAPAALNEVITRRILARLGSLGLALAALWLVAFHAILFWRRIADATIQHPGILARWVASAFLITAALAARRYALRHWHRPNTKVVFWSLVLLLHVTIPAEERLLGLDEALALAGQTGLIALSTTVLVFAVASTIPRVVRAGFASAAALHLTVHLLGSSATPRAPPAV